MMHITSPEPLLTMSQEGSTNIIRLLMSTISTFDEDGDDATAVKWMIHFFYHSEYPKSEESPRDALILHPKMYAIADKYDIPHLKSLALENFKAIAVANYSLPTFIDAVTFIYASVPDGDDGLRTIVLDLVIRHLRFDEEERLDRIFDTAPAVARDLVRTMRRGLILRW